MSVAIQLRGVGKSFYGRQVLDGIDLQLEAGRFYLLAGPNGVGKSTLMRVLMRQERLDAGSGRILGFALEGDDPRQNLETALVTESTDYALPLSLREVFARFPRIHPRWSANIFHEVQNELGFDLSRSYADLSRGQKMQVAMAAAFASQPKLLLLDEITSVLDARARDLIVERLRRAVAGGATVVLSTNIVTEVQHVADHLLILQDGRLRFDGRMTDVGRHFTWLRRPGRVEHAIFQDPSCVALGALPDGTRRYLAETSRVESRGVPAELIDRTTPVGAAEVFIYFTSGFTPGKRG